jgi:hypothetical protein
MSVAFWVTAVITLLSSGVSFGFSVAAVRRASGEGRTSALYTFARSSALLVVAVVALFTHSYGVVVAVAGGMIIVQAVDAVIGVITKNRAATVGPLVLTVLNSAALLWLLVTKLH